MDRTGHQPTNHEHHHSETTHREHDEKRRDEVKGQGDLDEPAGMVTRNGTSILGCRRVSDRSYSRQSLLSNHNRESFAYFRAMTLPPNCPK
jgi:hypothetical protein